MSVHMGRSWLGHAIEDDCPCPKAPCGLVSESVPACKQHWPDYFKTMRQVHFADQCTGTE